MNVRRWASAAAVALLVAAPFGFVQAQTRCTDADSVGCDWDPNHGWVTRGTVPRSSSSSGGYQAPAPVDQAAFEESQRRYQEDKRQKEADAERAAIEANYRAKAKAQNRANLPGPGTCSLGLLASPNGPGDPEVQRSMLEYSTQRCLQDHNAENCLAVAVRHATDTIPEARPNQAYRFMKLACQYGDTLSCEDMDVQCIPE